MVQYKKKECYPKGDGVYRIFLEEHPDGIYVEIFTSKDSQYPEYDYLQDDWEMAELFCREEFHIDHFEWKDISSHEGYR